MDKIAEHLNLSPDAINRLLDWTVEGYAWMQAGYDLLNNLQGDCLLPDAALSLSRAAQKNCLHSSLSCSSTARLLERKSLLLKHDGFNDVAPESREEVRQLLTQPPDLIRS